MDEYGIDHHRYKPYQQCSVKNLWKKKRKKEICLSIGHFMSSFSLVRFECSDIQPVQSGEGTKELI